MMRTLIGIVAVGLLGADWQALVAGIVVTAGMRLIALARDWRVPGWAGDPDERQPRG